MVHSMQMWPNWWQQQNLAITISRQPSHNGIFSEFITNKKLTKFIDANNVELICERVNKNTKDTYEYGELIHLKKNNFTNLLFYLFS